MPIAIDDLAVVAAPILAAEVSSTGTGLAMEGGVYSFSGGEPFIWQDSTPAWRVRITRPPELTEIADLIAPDDPEAYRTFKESHEEQANDLGRFDFSTWDVDALTALIEPGDLVEFHERGLCTGGGVIRDDVDTRKSKDTAKGKPFTKWEGVRPLGVLEETMVAPPRGWGSDALDRIWGWFGVTYDDDAWVPATQIVRHDGVSTHWTGLLPEFNDPSAYWIWASRRPGNPPLDQWSPSGLCLARRLFDVPTGIVEVEVEVAGDDVLGVYYEGEYLVGTGSFPTEFPDEVLRRRVPVVAGPNLIAIECTNSEDVIDDAGPLQNPAGILFAVYAVDPSTGERGSVLAHSDSSTLLLEYPASRPGVTPGHVLLECLAESKLRGCVTWVEPTFTAEVDSGGVPWAEVGEIGTKVGYSLWKLTQQLVAVYIDTDMTPGTNQWHAWSQGTRGRATSVVLAPPTGMDPETGNLQRHVVTRTLMRANVVASFSRFGWQPHTNWTAGRRIEAPLGLGPLPSSQEVDRWARAELAVSEVDRLQHEIDMQPTSDAHKPLWSYGIGDTITVGGDVLPVEAISWRRDEHGVVHWA